MVKVCTSDDGLGLCPGLQDVTMVDVTYGSDIRQHCGEQRPAYFRKFAPSLVARIGTPRFEFHRLAGQHGYLLAAGRAHCAAPNAGQTIAVRLDRCAVDDSLSDALGYQLPLHIEFEPTMPTTSGAASSWTNLVLTFHEQLRSPKAYRARRR